MQVEVQNTRPNNGPGPIQRATKPNLAAGSREIIDLIVESKTKMAARLGSVEERVNMAKTGENLRLLVFDQKPEVLRQVVESLGNDRTIEKAGI